MMTTESTSQNFLLLLKKNKRIQGNTCIFRMNRRMSKVANLHV